MCKQKKRSKIYNKKGEKEKPLKIRSFFSVVFFLLIIFSVKNYPPKLSYMMDDSSTPRLSNIAITDFDIGPGPHM